MSKHTITAVLFWAVVMVGAVAALSSLTVAAPTSSGLDDLLRAQKLLAHNCYREGEAHGRLAQEVADYEDKGIFVSQEFKTAASQPPTKGCAG